MNDVTLSGKATNRTLVYVVDDEPMTCEVVVLALHEAGYRTVTFHSASEALVSLEKGESIPDILVTDNQMPGMSGRELMVHARRLLPDLKIISISGTLTAEDRQNSLTQPDFYLPKPFSTVELMALIRALGRA